jgi:hypothetical protein
MSPLLDRFFSALPPGQYLDGPLPDLNLVVDVLMDVDAFVPSDWDLPGEGGIKREYELGPGADDDGGGPGRDVYRMRKHKARLGGD